MSIDKLTLLERREIEALIAAPLIRGYARELGLERSLSVATEVIQELARKTGRELAQDFGSNTIKELARLVPELWAKGNAIDVEILDQTEDTFAFNVTRCGYAETYQRLGLGDLGLCLSCSRDSAFAEGFNPGLKLTRTQTIMEGAPYCDFRFQLT